MLFSFGSSGLYGQMNAQRVLAQLLRPTPAADGQNPPGRPEIAGRALGVPEATPRLMANPRPLAASVLAALLGPEQTHEPTAAEQVAGLLEAGDQDGDGALSAAEVRSALRVDPDGPEAGLRTLDAAFNRLDQDADGRLDQAELTAARDSLGRDPDPSFKVRPGFIGLLIRDGDTDRDGLISPDDITAQLGRGYERQALAAGIARWDLDKDGRLSADEMQAVAIPRA